MARTRQKAKQRKAKRLEEERRAAERSQRREGGDGTVAETAQAAREVEDAQRDAAEELLEAQEVEVGAGREAARSAAAAEAATGAEAATAAGEAPAAPKRRERSKADAVETRPRERKSARERKPARAERKAPRKRGRVVNFLVQVWAELRRVQWPDRNQVTQATAVVVVFCLVAGVYLGVWDFLFRRLVRLIL